jgi:hypothetical protein
MATVELSLEEYETLRAMAHDNSCINCSGNTEEIVEVLEKPKRKPTAYNKAYSKAFRSIQNKYKMKSGSWKKNGFRNCCRAANKMC